MNLTYISSYQMPCRGYVLITYLLHLLWPMVDKAIIAHRPVMNLPQDVYDRLVNIH